MSDATQAITQRQTAEMSPLQTRALTIRDYIERAKPKLAEILPKHLTPERLTKIALVTVHHSALLLQCSPESILEAVMTAGQLGLEPGGALGSAYLVPYKNKSGQYECQLIPGYRGLVDLARRSGQITGIEAHPVYKGERFRVVFGLSPVLEHEPSTTGTRDANDIVCVYAVARPKEGPPQVEVMSRSEIDAIRERSRASRTGPWVTDYAEMARKTVVRRICKYLPLSAEMAVALEVDNRDYRDEFIDVDITAAADDRARMLAAKIQSARHTGQTPITESEAAEIRAREMAEVEGDAG